MKIIKKIIFFLFLLAGIAACSHVDEITPRSYVALLVSDTKQVKDEIEQALSKGSPIPKVGKFENQAKSGWFISYAYRFCLGYRWWSYSDEQ